MSSFGKVNKQASFLRDAVFASTDGIVTTFAVVSGSLGAALNSNIVIILGLANLFADGLSMSSGIFLGARSESDLEKRMGNRHWRQDAPFLQGLITFISFVVSGFVPLIPYLFNFPDPVKLSIYLVVAALIAIGILRAMVTGKNVIRGVLEMVIIGGLAALAAYFVGDIVEKILMTGR